MKKIVELYSSTIKELKKRNIIRTKNLTGDLAEYLVIQHYCKTNGLSNLRAAPIGTQNIDAISRTGERYSIKAVTGNVTGTFHGLQPKGISKPDTPKFEYIIIICKFDDEYHLEAIYELI